MDDVEGLWLSVADLGKARGITRQSAAERVDRLERLGQITTRPGKGRAKLVNVAEFDRATAGTVDGVRALNGGSPSIAPAGPVPIVSNDPVLIKEQARRAAYDADLKRLDLLARLKLTVPIDHLEASTNEICVHMVKAFDRLPAKLDDMMEACRQGPVAGKRFLRELAIELRTTIAMNLQKLVEEVASRPPRGPEDIEIPPDSETEVP